jgi:hypothetical protein
MPCLRSGCLDALGSACAIIDDFDRRAPIWAARQFNREHHPLQVHARFAPSCGATTTRAAGILYSERNDRGEDGRNEVGSPQCRQVSISPRQQDLDRRIGRGNKRFADGRKFSQPVEASRLFVAVALGGLVGFATARWFHR